MSNYKSPIKKRVEKNPHLKKGIAFQTWLRELGMQIADIRECTGYTQEQFANKLDMSQPTVARIESGQNMTCATLWQISDALELELDVFGIKKSIIEKEFEEFLSFLDNPEINTVAVTNESEAIRFTAYDNSFNNKLAYEQTTS